MGDAGQTDAPSRASLPSSNPTKSFWQTSHPNDLASFRSTVNLPSKSTIVLIGSGITAAWIAKTLLDGKPDLDLLVLEARTTCSGATGRNGGHLLPLVHDQVPNVVKFEIKNYNFVSTYIEHHKVDCDFRRLDGCLGFWNPSYFEEAISALKTFQLQYPEFAHLLRIVEDADQLEKLNLRRNHTVHGRKSLSLQADHLDVAETCAV